MKQYERYKDSGVEWLGRVPEHWDLVPNKYIFSLQKRLVGKKANKYVLLSLTLNGVIKRDMDNPQGKFPAEFDTYQKVCIGDFVFCHFDIEETPRTVGLSYYDGMITGAYTVYEVGDNFNKIFLYYYYLNIDNDKRLRFQYKGLRNTISKESFGSLKTFIPPLEEQKAIANYLDQKCAQIDKAISQKEKVIELLNERRQIIIQRAVTRGFNPNVPMKDSGIDWIGEIPEHWEVKKVTHLCSHIGSGTTPTTSNISYYQGNIKWLQTGDLNDNEITGCSKTITEKALKNFSTLKKYPVNSVVIAMYGATIGKLGIMKDSFATNQACCVLTLLDEEMYKYVFYWFWGIRKYIISLGYGGGQPNISQEIIKSMRLSIPPKNEQQQIAAYLDQVNAKIDKAISLKRQEIERLKEYKTVLIDAAVTGKIKIA